MVQAILEVRCPSQDNIYTLWILALFAMLICLKILQLMVHFCAGVLHIISIQFNSIQFIDPKKTKEETSSSMAWNDMFPYYT